MSQATVAANDAAPDAPWIPVGSPDYNAVLQFLYEEAAALDQGRFQLWLSMLTEDILYTAPLRVTKAISERDDSIDRSMMHFDENFTTLSARAGRLFKGRSAWAEDPPSRTRRSVTNLLLRAGDQPDEFESFSYLMLARNRFDAAKYDWVTAERRDLIRRTPDGLKLARREIIVDQAVLGTPNFAIFL
jgi:3-phenylpropionate/cinnamic acid dioxygenase small subunit